VLLKGQAACARFGHSAWVGRPDCWADWLIRGRQRGLDERQIRALTKELWRVRDRVLAGARLRPDMSVLDVGAGTGLLAVGARRRVGESGRVIALDTSTDALAECARSGLALGLVVGDTVALPLPDQCVEVVVMRSVLIYVADKARAASELHRVLRPGGRVSLFEPINSQYKSLADVDLSDLEPARSRVLERWQSGGDPGGAMGGFDDRDLVGHFVDAGFETVELTHEIVHRRTVARGPEVWASLTMRPNPNMVSYEEAAREVLGSTADKHLAALVSALTQRPATSVDASAYLRARRARH
jgi:arsenite methyltransferase